MLKKKIAVFTLILAFAVGICGCSNQSKTENQDISSYDTMVGKYITFGSYEQDNNTANDKEEIEWLILDVKDGKALLISKYGLDCMPYNTEKEYVTWEQCTLREWLNSTFIDIAFTKKEKDMISTVTVSADKNPKYDTDPGNATEDKVFLLSIEEVNGYFSSDEDRKCEMTKYANEKIEYLFEGYCSWWLRTPGSSLENASNITEHGSVDDYGDAVYEMDVWHEKINEYIRTSLCFVRPAIWINL